jgi:methionyl-tRNA formyltransferase
VVLSYGFLIPTTIIKIFAQGMIVVHPSLLPKYRGGAPIFHAILNGEKESGVSYIDISPNKFDEGNILHQVRT